MTIKESIRICLATLDKVSVAGKENRERLLGVENMLEQMAGALDQAEYAERQNAEKEDDLSERAKMAMEEMNG